MQNKESAQSVKDLSNVIKINEAQIHDHLGEMVRLTVEETLNAMLDAEADELCNAKRYERSAGRTNGRAGHYTRNFHTKAGEVEIQIPKLRYAKFETAIIERYKRREASVEEALMEMDLAGVSVRRVEGDCLNKPQIQGKNSLVCLLFLLNFFFILQTSLDKNLPV